MDYIAGILPQLLQGAAVTLKLFFITLALAVPPLPAIMMGVITACVGGIIRDVLAGEPSILLRPELYVTAAALSAALFVILAVWGVALLPAAGLAALAGFTLRALAIVRGWSIPAYSR